jgi:small conductance mechanosensitive channel
LFALSETVLLDVLMVAAVLIATAVVERIYVRVARHTLEHAGSSALFQATGFGSWVIWTVGIIIALSEIGVETTVLMLIFGLGIFGLVIGARDVLSSWIAGQVILAYKPFKLGDWIRVEHFYGRVVRIEDISTTIVTPTIETIILPNSMITRNATVNRTNPEGVRVSVPVEVRSEKDLHALMESMLRVGHELRGELVLDSSPEVRVTSVTDQSTSLELILHVANPGKDEMLRSEAMKMIRREIDRPRKKNNPYPKLAN